MSFYIRSSEVIELLGSIQVSPFVPPLTGLPTYLLGDDRKKFRILELALKFCLSDRIQGDIFSGLSVANYTPENLETCVNSSKFLEWYDGQFVDYLTQIHTAAIAIRSGSEIEAVYETKLIKATLPDKYWNPFVSTLGLSIKCLQIFLD